MDNKRYNRTKFACYSSYISGSAVFCLPPMLFVTFREMYNISYTLLGTLVLINFCTQFIIDMVFTLFSKKFNIAKTVRAMPVITAIGLTIYALYPTFFSDTAYVGLCIGTVIFSMASGLAEVLLSPVVAAIPSDNPERDMSFLHSLYAWGVLFVVVISTVFLNIFGTKNWMYLTLFFAFLPLISCILYCISPMPEIKMEQATGKVKRNREQFLLLAFFCIFLGGAAENTMTNWISSYLEKALNVSKAYGDILGLALFALFLGLGRTLYAKYGKKISKTLLMGMVGATICYLTASFSNNALVGLLACILTGFSASMLWPGTLILMEERVPNPGVGAYALMAAGGDFGSSIAPQLMGVMVDKVGASTFANELSLKLGITAEQIGMKAGMLVSAFFPILGIALLIYINKKYYSVK